MCFKAASRLFTFLLACGCTQSEDAFLLERANESPPSPFAYPILFQKELRLVLGMALRRRRWKMRSRASGSGFNSQGFGAGLTGTGTRAVTARKEFFGQSRMNLLKGSHQSPDAADCLENSCTDDPADDRVLGNLQ
jgi:hypothetical protein